MFYPQQTQLWVCVIGLLSKLFANLHDLLQDNGHTLYLYQRHAWDLELLL